MNNSILKTTVSLVGLCVMTGFSTPDCVRLETWKFTPSDGEINRSSSHWQNVTVPHTWNAKDGQDGGSYYRGPGWYQRQLNIEDAPAEHRYFLRFHAVGTVADIYIDQHKVATHSGGYTAFATEITPWVSEAGSYDLRVRADNTDGDTVAPLSGDFTVQGGMHRPVDLLIKYPVCISPLDYASPGVYLFQENVSEAKADLRVRVLVDNGTKQPQKTHTIISIMDDQGKEVAKKTIRTRVAAGKVEPAESVVSVTKPHLWGGVKDPYLYTLKIELYAGETKVDQYVKKTGFRYLHIDAEKGFFLNGKSYPLHGVNMHFDREKIGSALTKADIDEAFERITEVGANTLRLAHYPHADYSYEKCDELGILAWSEIPLVNEVKNSPEFNAISRGQLLDMVKQLGNHCSIFCWSICNEIFQAKTDDPFDLLNELNALCKKTDPTRYTTLATNHNRKDLIDITDLFAINIYPGWYGSNPFDMKGALRGYNDKGGKRGVGVSEYGAGGAIEHQDQTLKVVPPGGKWHPEQWQAYLHEVQYRDIVENPACWGSYVWPMFDFSSDGRNEGAQPGVNDKGLMTHDYKTRKDSFYFYQANWSEKPMLHLTSKRHLIRNQQETLVKIYSNCSKVELFVNGHSVGTLQPNDLHIALWEKIELMEGENQILVKATADGKILTDEIVWTFDPQALSLETINNRRNEISEGLFRTSDAESGNGPGKAFDGNPETRWASSKKGAWVGRELERNEVINGISILWNKGDERSYRFKVEASTDGNTWRPVYEGESKKMSGAEIYTFSEPDEARHIRIICFGSDVNEWSSIKDVTVNQ